MTTEFAAATPPPVIEFGSHAIIVTRGPSLALAQCIAAFDRTLGQQPGEWKFNERWLEETLPPSEVHSSLSCKRNREEDELVEEYMAYLAKKAKKATKAQTAQR
eukprot:3251097-Rhodomonas_salina.3